MHRNSHMVSSVLKRWKSSRIQFTSMTGINPMPTPTSVFSASVRAGFPEFITKICFKTMFVPDTQQSNGEVIYAFLQHILWCVTYELHINGMGSTTCTHDAKLLCVINAPAAWKRRKHWPHLAKTHGTHGGNTVCWASSVTVQNTALSGKGFDKHIMQGRWHGESRDEPKATGQCPQQAGDSEEQRGHRLGSSNTSHAVLGRVHRRLAQTLWIGLISRWVFKDVAPLQYSCHFQS